MCLTPKTIPGVGVVNCRTCRLCLHNYRKDWVGRCIAEKLTSTKTFVVTLTYGGGDHEDAHKLNYRHIQLMLKNLRIKGYRVRYMVAGEYGTTGERAHWHMVLFFQGKYPRFNLNTRYNHKMWEHGFIFVEEPHHANFYYATKYTTKKTNERVRELAFRYSKVPALGHNYFMQLAKGYFDEKIAPPNFTYQFKDVKGKEGKPVVFLMQGKTKENFMATFHALNITLEEPLYSECYDKWLLEQDISAEPMTPEDWAHYWKPRDITAGKEVLSYESVDGPFYMTKQRNGTIHFGKLDKNGVTLWERDVQGEHEKALALRCKLGPDAVRERRLRAKEMKMRYAARERRIKRY